MNIPMASLPEVNIPMIIPHDYSPWLFPMIIPHEYPHEYSNG